MHAIGNSYGSPSDSCEAAECEIKNTGVIKNSAGKLASVGFLFGGQ